MSIILLNIFKAQVTLLNVNVFMRVPVPIKSTYNER